MKILIVGEPAHFEECRLKFSGHELVHTQSHGEAVVTLGACDVVFDFIISRQPEQIRIYEAKKIEVFLNTTMVTLASLTHYFTSRPQCTLFGFNGFPTLFNRPSLEVSLFSHDDVGRLQMLMDALKTDHLIVEDRVGLVTPRVICMIINEAYYTVQEATATREDIDLAMKLGTNYPHGPFEWSKKIGLNHVYELLNALYEDTREERYKISALMKTEYLRLGHSASA